MRLKVNRKLFRKILSLILVITISVTGLNLDMMSESVFAEEKTATAKEKITVVKELADERTENSNTYLLSDGSKKTDFFMDDARYEEEGKMVDYDPSIVNLNQWEKKKLKNTASGIEAEKYIGVNHKGDPKQYFPKKLGTEGIVMSYDRYSLALTPEISGNTCEAVVDGDSVTYTDERNDVSYRYKSLANGVKEEIILESKPVENEFKFAVELENITLKLENGAIYLLDSKTKEKTGYIMPPNMTDGGGNVNYEDISYEIGKNNVIKVVIDNSYFENEKLEYPVVIDPTPVWFSGTLSTAIVNSMQYVSNMNLHSEVLNVENKCNTRPPYNGSEQRVYLDTGKIASGECFIQGPGDISDKYIEEAVLSIRENESSYTNGTVEIYKPEETFDTATITWDNQPQISSRRIGECEFTNTPGTIHRIDITEWAQDIASGAIEDTGMVFVAKEEGTGDSFNGPELTHQGYMWISVTYRDIEKYDASVELNAEYDPDAGKISTVITDNNELGEGVTVKGYKIFARENDKEKFTSIYQGTDINENAETDIKYDKVDYRVCILYSDGTVKPSNVVSFEKNTETSEDEDGNEVATVSYEQTVFDTDGDGLEDGYEIWDFKTLWNTETEDSTEDNPVYEQDSDGDGLPDGYEVFTLGTDPAVANESGADSDSDGWTDFKEYQEGTDPWLKDSDFDGTNDRGDATPRKTNDYTRQTRAAEAAVHKGLYDREYSETIDGVTYTYITNIYRGDVKQISVDYGNTSLNKVMKYFYDVTGNNTAIVEAYDESYDSNHTQTICITYTYDTDGNVTFICDQRTKYTMDYGTDGQMTQLKVGNQTLMTYGDVELVNNTDSNGDITNIQIGAVIDKNEHTETYGNGQSVKTVTTTYKVADKDTTSTATKTETYYNSDSNPTYVAYLNSDGEIIKLQDNSTNNSSPVEWNYSYVENGTSVTRSDGFTKSIQTSEDEDTGALTTVTSYGFKDLNNSSRTYSSTITAQPETETDAEGLEQEKIVVSQTLHNGDTVNIESADNVSEEKIRSNAYHTNVIKSTYEKDKNTHATYNVDIYAGAADKEFDYTYDLTGNITKIKLNGDVRYEYAYDAHGRLTTEKDYTILKEYTYDYNTNGNVYGKTEYPINADGNRTDSDGTTIHYTYGNSEWPDQLTTYNGQTITYDNSGNPLTYVDGLEFTWNRSRQLSTVTLGDGSTVSYGYNENGLRTYKDTGDTTTIYEWDGSTLIRETVTYKATNQKVDVWYLYDANGSAIGFEYSYLNFAGTLVTARVYYEKNLQGDVIGLLDAGGAEIAAYAYDAWGNVTSSTYVEGNEIPYELNHITYRGYYRDEETGFYYLQSRYYDAEVGRFLNADDTSYLGASGTVWGYNLYAYCENNPVKYDDLNGTFIGTCIIVGALVGAVVGGVYAAYKSKKKLGYVKGKWVLGGVLIGGGVGALAGWGVGAACSALGVGATAGSSGTLGSTIYASWQNAEQALRNSMKSVSTTAQRTLSTQYGKRIVDSYNASRKVIGEAKYGYQSLSQSIQKQIEKDAWLLRTGKVKSVEWHFYWSKVSKTGGPSGPLLKELLKRGFKVKFH